MKKTIFAFIIPCLVLLVITLTLQSCFNGTQNVDITDIIIQSNKIPADNPGLKIVHISDLHIAQAGNYEKLVADKINQLEPDIIIITGDFFKHSEYLELQALDQMRAEMEQIMLFLSSLQSKNGIYISRGNADFSNDREVSNYFIEELEKQGYTVLADRGMTLTVHNNLYYLFGIDYPAFDKTEVADFQIRGSGENQYMQSLPSHNNSYSHYYDIKNAQQWQNYTYSGRLRVNNTEKNGAGVTFYSHFYYGYDYYYRLRQAGSGGTFHFSAHGSQVTGDNIDSGISISAGEWVHFKIQCTTLADHTEMRARLWNEGTPEPSGWSANAVDYSKARLTGGTVGLWSGGQGKHQFDDLLVVNDNGDTLLNENFEQAKMQHAPPLWVAYNYSYQAIPVLMRDADPKIFSIMLAHTPDYAFYAIPHQVDLVLSGHTHGGQIRLPVIGPLYKNIKSSRKYMQGLHDLNGTMLYVTRGIGAATPELRLFCPPEITTIHIIPEKR